MSRTNSAWPAKLPPGATHPNKKTGRLSGHSPNFESSPFLRGREGRGFVAALELL
jgi:hypothetical protein